jgi:hypothetical protein
MEAMAHRNRGFTYISKMVLNSKLLVYWRAISLHTARKSCCHGMNLVTQDPHFEKARGLLVLDIQAKALVKSVPGNTAWWATYPSEK